MKLRNLLPIILLSVILALGCSPKSNQEMTPDQQIAVLNAKIKKNSKDAELYYQRAEIYLQLEKVNDAINDLIKAVELEPKVVKYHTLLGDAYFKNGNVENSYKSLQEAIRLEPKNLEANLKLGEIAFYSKDYDRAMECLTKVTSVDKNNRTAFFMKGYIYKETGDTTNAVYYFRRVIDLYPDFEPAYEEMGVLYANIHNPLAVEYLNTALKLEPKNVNALYAMAMYFQEIEEPDKANEYYTKILEIDPLNKFAWHNRGYMEMVLYEDYDAAIDFFTQAIDADNQYVEAHSNRGLCYELKGDRNNAKICYSTALSIDPDYEPAKKGLQRVKQDSGMETL